MILGLSIIVAHLLHFPVNLIAKKIKLILFKLEEGEFPLYFDLPHGLEQALGRIQQLEAAVHSSLGWLLKQPTIKFKASSTPSNSC